MTKTQKNSKMIISALKAVKVVVMYKVKKNSKVSLKITSVMVLIE